MKKIWNSKIKKEKDQTVDLKSKFDMAQTLFDKEERLASDIEKKIKEEKDKKNKYHKIEKENLPYWEKFKALLEFSLNSDNFEYQISSLEGLKKRWVIFENYLQTIFAISDIINNLQMISVNCNVFSKEEDDTWIRLDLYCKKIDKKTSDAFILSLKDKREYFYTGMVFLEIKPNGDEDILVRLDCAFLNSGKYINILNSIEYKETTKVINIG